MQHTTQASITQSFTSVATTRTASACWQVIVLLALAIVLWSAATPLALAQNVQYTKNSVSLGLRSPFKINPSNNALELQIPLGPTAYPQRGGASVAPTLDYSSRIWRMAYNGTISNQNGPVSTLVVPRFAEYSRMGWTFSLASPFIDTDPQQNEPYDYLGNPVTSCTVGGAQGATCCFIDRIRIHLPDGSVHEFRSTDHPFCVDSNGNSPTLPDDLYSVDGSEMHYQRASHKLSLPDGSYWILSTGTNPAQYFDRNGNQLLSGMTDSLNRTFTSPLSNTTDTEYTYTVPGVGGTTLSYTLRWRNLDQALTVSQALPNYSDDCVSSGCTGPFLFTSDTGQTLPIRVVGGSNKINPQVLYQIVLPHDSSNANPPTYTFTYNVYGEIDKVVYPTGGYERFQYGYVEPQQTGSYVYAEANRGVTDRWVSVKGDGTDEVHWQYFWTDTQGQPHRGEINPDGTRTERVFYSATVGTTYWSYGDGRAGRPSQETVYNAAGQMLRRKLMTWTNTVSDNCYQGAYSTCTATRNPRLTKEVDILLDTGGAALAQTTIHNYDSTYEFSIGDIETSATAYDYVALDQSTAQSLTLSIDSIPAGNPLRTQETINLLNDQNIAQATRDAYRARNLVSLPTVTRLRQGGVTGTIVSEAHLSYDQTDYPLLTYSTVLNWTDPQTIYRGNATTVGKWLNTTNTYLETHAQYDQVGNVRKSWDAKGNLSQVDYTDSFSDQIARNTYAFPTSTTSPIPDSTGANGSNSALGTSSQYDFNTGLVMSATDANGQVTTLSYNDPLDRLKSVTRPTGGGSTSYEYGDTPGNLYIHTQTSLDAARSLDAYQYFDKMGRAVRTLSYDGDATLPWVAVDTQYDQMDRVQWVSNPYRVSSLSGVVAACGDCTTTDYDELGRVKKITSPDGAQVVTVYGANTTDTLGTTVTVTDQAGKQRKSLTDVLGRLIQVTEDPTSNGLNYQTSYGYDLLGNLLTVIQGAQTRTFTYDSLSRLALASNPESGTINYHYDNNSNLDWKTDARGVKVSYAYDALNRVKTRTYSLTGAAPSNYVASPDATYFYDGTGMPSDITTPPINSKGKLTAVQSTVAKTVYTEFDALGHVTKNRQIVDPGTSTEQSYLMEYSYNLAGALTSEKYPSGRIVATDYDNAGRISGVKNFATNQYYAGDASTGDNRIQYAAHGAVSDMRLGNGLWEHALYNNRLQPSEIGLGTAKGGVDRVKLAYTYTSGTSTTDNNGNVLSQTITVPTIGTATGFTATQSYTYDPLNRLQSMSETGGLSQTFDYDRYGNRIITAGFVQNTTQTPNTIQNQTTLADWYDQSTNKLKTANYDAVGNVIKDTAGTNQGNTFDYDAENKQVRYDNGSVSGGADYQYDGDGHRVKKVDGTGQATTIYVYDAMGQMVAEYATTTPTGSGGTSYLTADHLGTPRVITGTNINDANGGVKARHDYLPFGEEVSAGVGGRTAAQGYSSDNVAQKFTGKMRDGESGLDYFEARYYSSAQGRFTSPDEFNGGPTELYADVAPHDPLFYADIANPQSLNKYQYCLNNPLRFVDPDGHQEVVSDVIKAAQAVSSGATSLNRVMSIARPAIRTINGAASALSEDNGLGPMDAEQNSLGRGIGHVLALGQSAAEIVAGTATIVTGGALAVGSDGVLAAPAAEVSGAGAVVAAHGAYVGANTLHNIFSSNTSEQGGTTQAKESKVQKSTTTREIGDGKFTETREVRPGRDSGQSRAEYVRVRNSQGKVIRTYKDSYDRANNFMHRKPLRGGPEGRPQD